MNFRHLLGSGLALSVWFGLATLALPVTAQDKAKAPGAAKKTDPDRYFKKLLLPFDRGLVVVCEGDFEPRSLGSYSVRWYSAENKEFPFDDFLSGCIRAREDGYIEDVRLQEIDGDGLADVVVVIRSVGNAGGLSAEAFACKDKKIHVLASAEDLAADADVVRALRLKRLRGSKPGSPEWNGAVEALVRVGDQAGHGPDLGSAEWQRAVNGKLFGAAEPAVLGSPQWLAVVAKALEQYQGGPEMPPAQSGTLGLDGYGDIRFGDSLPAVLAKLKQLQATMKDVNDEPVGATWWQEVKKAHGDGACAVYVTASCYPGVRFLVEDEKIVRADLSMAGLRSRLQVEVGMSVAEVLKLCPAAKFELDKYAEEGEDLKNAFIPSPDGKAGWRITEKDGQVTEIRAGLQPAIEYVENG